VSRLQPKNILNQRRLFSRILGYSAALHLIVLGVLLFNNPQQSFRFSLTATAIDANIPIVFVSHPKPRGGGVRGSGNAATTATAQTASVPAVMPKRGTTLVQEKPAAKKNKKNSKHTKKAKLEGKKKPEIKKKQISKTPEQKKVELPKKEVEKPIAPIPEAPVALASSTQDATAQGGTLQDQNVLYVTHEEFDALQKEEYLRNEVSSCWQCPPGLNPDLSCVVKVSVDHEGNVADVAIDSSSGVLIFDTSAKMALGAFTPPPWSYGNSLLITFKQ
jgi:outer membrane biosynthesis protein TonB